MDRLNHLHLLLILLHLLDFLQPLQATVLLRQASAQPHPLSVLLLPATVRPALRLAVSLAGTFLQPHQRLQNIPPLLLVGPQLAQRLIRRLLQTLLALQPHQVVLLLPAIARPPLLLVQRKFKLLTLLRDF